jgi:hypothetical protein
LKTFIIITIQEGTGPPHCYHISIVISFTPPSTR